MQTDDRRVQFYRESDSLDNVSTLDELCFDFVSRCIVGTTAHHEHFRFAMAILKDKSEDIMTLSWARGL